MIDIHTHLNTDAFPDREAALARAKTVGVEAFVLVGYDLPTSEKAVQLSHGNRSLYACCGIHPHDASKADEPVLKKIEELCCQPRTIAVGETGLDFYRTLSPMEKQIEAFLKQKEIASRLRLPLMIHCRDAYDELLPLVREAPPLLMHCFQGDKKMLSAFLDLGGYISFAGPLTYPKNSALREIAAACPINRLFIETDCPYLPPQPYRGKRNEPAYLKLVAETLCKLKGIELFKLEEAIQKNFLTLFGKKVCPKVQGDAERNQLRQD